MALPRSVASSGKNTAQRPANPEFVPNDPRYLGASILLARRNFGCGSSREHAPWALADYGFHAIIAPSFADIFFNNCFKNGLLPIVLGESEVDGLFHPDGGFPGSSSPSTSNGRPLRHRTWRPVIQLRHQSFRKHCMLNGLDDIGLTLKHADEIRAFEAKRKAEQPWLF